MRVSITSNARQELASKASAFSNAGANSALGCLANKVGAEIFEPDYRVVAESARQQQEDARSRKECPVAMRMNFIT